MKHKIEIAPNLAIYIDGERVIGSKPHGLFLTTTMIVSDDDLKRLADRCFEVISDRKTESNSEKPNNSTISKMEQVDKLQTCDTCRFELYCPEMCEGCCEWDSHYEPKDEPTISKMEQVDELQTKDYCDICNHKGCEYCISDSRNPYCIPSNYEPRMEGNE